MSLVQDDDMVQAFTADTPDQAFDIGVLPGTPGSPRQDILALAHFW
jgi:hypothetical protein